MLHFRGIMWCKTKKLLHLFKMYLLVSKYHYKVLQPTSITHLRKKNNMYYFTVDCQNNKNKTRTLSLLRVSRLLYPPKHLSVASRCWSTGCLLWICQPSGLPVPSRARGVERMESEHWLLSAFLLLEIMLLSVSRPLWPRTSYVARLYARGIGCSLDWIATHETCPEWDWDHDVVHLKLVYYCMSTVM